MSQSIANNFTVFFGIIAIIVAIFQVFITWLISESINKFAKETEQLSNTRNINEQWQRFNMMSVSNDDFVKVQKSIGYEDVDDGDLEIRKRATIFNILNILRDTYYALESKSIINSFAEGMIKSHAGMLSYVEKDVLNILDSKRGYGKEFSQKIKDLMRETLEEKEAHGQKLSDT